MNVVLTPLRSEYRVPAGAFLGAGVAGLMVLMLLPEQASTLLGGFWLGAVSWLAAAGVWAAVFRLFRRRRTGIVTPLGIATGAGIQVGLDEESRPPQGAAYEEHAEKLRRQVWFAALALGQVAISVTVIGALFALSHDGPEPFLLAAWAGSFGAGQGLYYLVCDLWVARLEKRTGFTLLAGRPSDDFYVQQIYALPDPYRLEPSKLRPERGHGR